jgi:flagellar basal body-associated protein FliL
MKIKDFKNKETFKIPEGYFENLQNKIASKTYNNNATIATKSKKHVNWITLGYAASIAAIAICGIFAFNKSESNYNVTASEEYYDKEYIDNILTN